MRGRTLLEEVLSVIDMKFKTKKKEKTRIQKIHRCNVVRKLKKSSYSSELVIVH